LWRSSLVDWIGVFNALLCHTVSQAVVGTRHAQDGRDDASSATGSASAPGWDVDQDLADQLSNQGINGGSRAASIDSRTTASAQDIKGWESEDDWNDDDPPPRKLPTRPAPSIPDGESFNL
jgi:hypothetical protein